jgi:hypothetical protein
MFDYERFRIPKKRDSSPPYASLRGRGFSRVFDKGLWRYENLRTAHDALNKEQASGNSFVKSSQNRNNLPEHIDKKRKLM